MEVIRIQTVDKNSGFWPDLPWRRSSQSKCFRLLFVFSRCQHRPHFDVIVDRNIVKTDNRDVRSL